MTTPTPSVATRIAAVMLCACFTTQSLADQGVTAPGTIVAAEHSAKAQIDAVPARPFTIAGEIVDEHGNPTPGVTVTILAHGGEAVTDDLGRYIIDTHIPLDADSIAIVASLPDDRTGQRITTHTASIQYDDPFLDAGVMEMRSEECEPVWSDQKFAAAGANARVRAIAIYDDGLGGGPALYIGGDFAAVHDRFASHIARWDGNSWSALGSGTDGPVYAMRVYDDGPGSALFVGGLFEQAGEVTANNIARWNGTEWSALTGSSGTGTSAPGPGTGANVLALEVYNDGTGPALFVGGSFTIAGGITVNRIAKWDGADWTALDNGTAVGTSGQVSALIVYGGSGQSELMVGGHFATAGGITVNRVARWNGSNWLPLPGINGAVGVSGWIASFAILGDGIGSPPELYMGGAISSAGGHSSFGQVARWVGTQWQPGNLPSPIAHVHALTVFDDGNGPKLYAGRSSTLGYLVRLEGSSWVTPPAGNVSAAPSGTVHAFVTYNDGSGPALYVGGGFGKTGEYDIQNLARMKDDQWSHVGNAPLGVAANANTVYAIPSMGTQQPRILVGGSFTSIGAQIVNAIAEVDGASWSTFEAPGGIGISGEVRAVVSHDDGSGENVKVYAAGHFDTAGGVSANNIAVWDGTAWSALANGLPAFANALVMHDEGNGPNLFVGGFFNHIIDEGGQQINARRIARWDGTQWTQLRRGLTSGFSVQVLAMLSYDDGSGPALYVGGQFTGVHDMPANNIALWQDNEWHALGNGLNNSVRALAVFDDGNGPALYAAGAFTHSGSQPIARIARWTGSEWAPLVGGGVGPGHGVFPGISALAVFDDGSGNGPELYVGGNFTLAGGMPANHLAKWNGSEWQAVDLGTNGRISDMIVVNEGPGNAQSLYIVGEFTTANESVSSRVAILHGCPIDLQPPPPCPGDINADGVVNLADFNILAVNFGAGPGATLAQGDLNGDGFVNLADFNILAVNFGNDCN